MIDLHTHILPGVDDGVRSEDDAVEFAAVAARDGIRTIVATPHCREGFYLNDRACVLEGVGRLRERLDREGIPVELRPGAEVHIAPDLVAKLRDGRAPSLGDNGKTLLLELSTSQYPLDLDGLIFELRLAGFQVLLAHPERIRYFQDDIRRYESAVRVGAFGQITTGSILGVFGERAESFSRELLARRLVHVIASDAHNVRGRPPVLSGAVAAAAEIVGESYARRMTTEFPEALLAGREPEVELPREEERRPSLFARLFGRSR